LESTSCPTCITSCYKDPNKKFGPQGFAIFSSSTKVIHDFTNCYADEWHKDRKIEDGQMRHPADSIT